MKKLILFIITGTMLVLTGCGPDAPSDHAISSTGEPPDYSINHPVVTADGSGGIIVACQVNYGSGTQRKTYVQRLGEQGDKLWGDEGIELASDRGGFDGHGENTFAALVNDNGENILIFCLTEDSVVFQKLNMQGGIIQGPETLSLVDAASNPYLRVESDCSGGAVAAWIESGSSIGIVRLDSGSSVMWRETLSVPDIDKYDMMCDSSGNTYLLWKDNPSCSEGKLFLEKIDSDGNVWNKPNLLVADVTIVGSIEGRICGDDIGGAVITWMNSQTIFVQHVSADGEFLWDSGIRLADVYSDPRIIRNDSGYSVFWRNGSAVGIQYIDRDTMLLEDGIEQSVDGERSQVYFSATNGNNPEKVAFTWNCTEEGARILRAQCLDSTGNKLWGEEGIVVSIIAPYWAGYAAPARISPDGTGGFIVSWASGESIKDKTSSYLQRIDADGTVLWSEQGIQLDK